MRSPTSIRYLLRRGIVTLVLVPLVVLLVVGVRSRK